MRDKRKARAALRKPFPRPAPSPDSLDTAALAGWIRECTLQRVFAPAWSLDGFRWRRASRRASLEFTARVLSDAGPPPAMCEHCHAQVATRHIVYEQDAPRFAHYCSACGPSMPHGWMVVMSSVP